MLIAYLIILIPVIITDYLSFLIFNTIGFKFVQSYLFGKTLGLLCYFFIGTTGILRERLILFAKFALLFISNIIIAQYLYLIFLSNSYLIIKIFLDIIFFMINFFIMKFFKLIKDNN
jgi:hypothetical protein